jgi:hypothetical protein
MSIRITSIPRPNAPNSGYHPTKIAEILNDEVWAIPAKGRYIGKYKNIKFFFFDKKVFHTIFPGFFIRILFLINVFFKALIVKKEIFFVHSFLYALPLFLAKKNYVIVIHGSDYKYLDSFIGKIIAKKANKLFGVGIEKIYKDFRVKEIPNIFDLNGIVSKKSLKKSYDVIFVLREADVKNPTYPFKLFKHMLLKNITINIAVVGINESFLSNSERSIIRKNTTKTQIKYYGRCSFNKVVALMKASKFLIIPSHTEGVAKAMLEGMACGLNIVISKELHVPSEFNKKLIKVDLYNWKNISNLVLSDIYEENNEDNINFAINYHNNSTNKLSSLYNEIINSYSN